MNNVEEFRRKITRIVGAQVATETHNADRSRISLPSSGFPVPGLLFVAIRDLLGIEPFGPAEKLAWGFSLFVNGRKVEVTLEKFGLYLYATETDDVAVALKKCCNIAERYLEPSIKLALTDAKVTLNNQYHKFDAAYRFFREKAEEAFNRPKENFPWSEIKENGRASWSPFRFEREGGYFATAMMDSFFSRLEHTLVMLAPFTRMDLKNRGLTEFVGLPWGEKFKQMFDISCSTYAKTLYDELVQTKEAFRNPNSHGGFLKKGASFYFHTSAGALPVLLTKSNRGIDFVVTSVPSKTYDEICELFDKVDEFLASCDLGEAFEYVDAGLPIAVDDASRREYWQALDDEEFANLIEIHSDTHEQHMNMDY